MFESQSVGWIQRPKTLKRTGDIGCRKHFKTAQTSDIEIIQVHKDFFLRPEIDEPLIFGIVKLEVVHSVYFGRCYTFEVNGSRSLGDDSSVRIWFRNGYVRVIDFIAFIPSTFLHFYAVIKSPDVYFHSPGEEIGVLTNTWTTPPQLVRLKPGFQTTAMLSKQVSKELNICFSNLGPGR